MLYHLGISGKVTDSPKPLSSLVIAAPWSIWCSTPWNSPEALHALRIETRGLEIPGNSSRIGGPLSQVRGTKLLSTVVHRVVSEFILKLSSSDERDRRTTLGDDEASLDP